MRIAIIGAGMCGLTTAWNLQKKGHDVTIFEKESIPGGLASGFREPQWENYVEKFYHHWFKTDTALMQLMKELDLFPEVEFKKPTTVMFYNGKFYPFDSIPVVILYPGLGFGINKIRFGFIGLYLKLTKNWKSLEKFTAESWMTKYAGAAVYHSMWEPMMVGKFGEQYAHQVNMAWLWARIYSRTTQLGTYRGGMQSFFSAFTAKLRERGVNILFNSAIRSVSKNGEIDLIVETEDQTSHFDRVIITTSPKSFLDLVPEITGSYRDQLQSLKSIGAVVLVVSLKRPLSPKGYYWYNLPKNAGFPFLALVEHTNFVPSSKFHGETIIYAGDYLESEHEYFSLSERDLLQRFIPGFQKINPEFSADWILNCWKFSTYYAQPIPFLNHSANIPDVKTPIRGLYFASMSHIYPWDRGTNYSVELANHLSSVI